MTITDQVTKNIVSRVLKSLDYRIEIVNLINAEFLQFAVDFFKKVALAKMDSDDITVDWYKKTFMSENLTSDEICINSGLNKKTINNMYRTASRNVVLEASAEHFDSLYESIKMLTEIESDVDLTLTIKYNKVSVDLNINESLIVINTLAVKRAALRGGAWSTAGKQAEKILMLTLCKLYQVPEANFNAEHFVKDQKLAVDREIDFYLINEDKKYKCEVKLMGQGNPESADAIIARSSNVFVADTLSEQNKNQCKECDVVWVACRDKEGFRRFKIALEKFEIPHTDYDGNLDEDIERILEDLFA